MGMNLSTIVSGILIGFFVATVFAVGFTNMSASFGNPTSLDTSFFSTTNSVTAANNIENTTRSTSMSVVNTFFPALGTLFNVWDLIKASFADFTQTMENAAKSTAFGGDPLLVSLTTIIIAVLLLGITFIILAALFRLGSWKIQ